LEKAIEIKRRAQRCVQNGDVDGALREYEKLVDSPDADPYNYVLLADLLHKKGDHGRAGERYLNAVTAYELAGLFKNGIAVCKKMMRLSLSQGEVLRHLAELHAKDNLPSEASVYYAQYAEYALRSNRAPDAIAALRKAFDHGQENVKLLERLSEVLLLEGETQRAADAMLEASQAWATRGQSGDSERCRSRADIILPGAARANGAIANPAAPPGMPPAAPTTLVVEPPLGSAPAPGTFATPPAPVEVESPGILTGSRIPETAPTLFVPGTQPPPAPAPVAQAPAAPTAPPAFEHTPTSPLLGPADAPPRMDSSIFERAPSFTSPPSTPVAATPTPEPTPADAFEPEAVTPAEGVYDIGTNGELSYEAALREAAIAPAPKPVEFAREPIPAEPTPSLIARRPEELLGSVQNVEELLQRAQLEFRAGHRERASQALVEAALAYERLDRLDSAATIFRSLGRGATAPVGVMELWLANCEKRSDHVEGSQVACELGDRALNDGHEAEARRWFERSLTLHAANDTARRRLQRLANSVAAQAAPPAEAPGTEVGRVAVAVGRGQAVTFDLGSLLQEFQRGVASQLEGDAQGHYDLGMAYREMGLHDEAVGSFRIAEHDPRLAVRSQEMIGRCLADSGRHDDAAKEFERALLSPILDAAGEAELRYQFALSLAALGAIPDALAQLEIADMRFPGRPDIAERLEEWRRSFGQAA
jgi:tetratricopeptide (TPR) repeat protein